ncbi:MAG TPA: hypothetical protein V6C81_23690 [Planktothrix sp.]|jgi:hypothetical protein
MNRRFIGACLALVTLALTSLTLPAEAYHHGGWGYRGGWHGGWGGGGWGGGWGWGHPYYGGFGSGFALGTGVGLVGGALINRPRYYGGYPAYPAYGPYGYAPYPGYGVRVYEGGPYGY